LRGAIEYSELDDGINSVLEIVIDGLSLAAVEAAMRVGITAAAKPGIKKISAGNYGGGLGQHHIHLHQLLASKDWSGEV
jgi:formylmethanofuran--tetrahydromethanopterin N-formyltransferase